MLWGLLNLLLFGATSHALNFQDYNLVIGAIAYPLLNVLIGIWLFFDDLSKPFQLIRLALIAILGVLQVYVAADYISTVEGGVLYVLLTVVLLLFIANGSIFFAEIRTIHRKQ